MGSGVSSSKASLSEVGIKNEIGVLYDASAKQAFDAAATEGPDGTPVAAWPAIEAHAKQHDERALDPRKCMYQNLKAFKAAREQIDEIARVHIKGAVREIPWVGKNLGDECRQCGLDGKPAESLDALYEVAALATVEFEAILTGACPEGVELKLAPLKGRGRAGAKARDEYANKTAPCFSWLFDITRGSALCQSENDIVKFYKALEADPRVDIVRTKNRFAPPLFNGYQDILMNVAVKVENVTHLCELQIHLMPIKDSEALHKSHTVYEYFRSFFLGNSDAVAQRLEMLCKLPVDEAEDVVELVDHVLGSGADANLLEGLCELLKSISESTGVVKVREVILVEKEREFGAESTEAGVALFDLGSAYGRLGDQAKKRDMLERALAIKERAYGRDHTNVANTLMNLGNAYGALGDPAKERDMQERALAIEERAYGRDHTEVAITLGNLGNAYGSLGDYAKARDMLERALAIEERAYGGDHTSVAITLANLGTAYGALGDYAKMRDVLERALAINESKYGADHSVTTVCREALASLSALMNSPLHVAAKKGDIEAVTQLLEDGAEVNRTLPYGQTPLFFACGKGHVDAARLLLERGADVHKSDSHNSTPLHISCFEGHIEVVRMLLANGADMNSEDKDGDKPIVNALVQDHSAIVGLLETASL